MCDDGPLISWKSKKQATGALSTCEAEYIALGATVQEGKFLRQLMKDISDTVNNFTVMVDNQGAIALAKNPVTQQRSKHIDIKYHLGVVQLEYVPTDLNVADAFTKAVSSKRLMKLICLSNT